MKCLMLMIMICATTFSQCKYLEKHREFGKINLPDYINKIPDIIQNNGLNVDSTLNAQHKDNKGESNVCDFLKFICIYVERGIPRGKSSQQAYEMLFGRNILQRFRQIPSTCDRISRICSEKKVILTNARHSKDLSKHKRIFMSTGWMPGGFQMRSKIDRQKDSRKGKPSPSLIFISTGWGPAGK
ncbi:Uncharacterised protein at_DN2057 [Pycnogonum litorale]